MTTDTLPPFSNTSVLVVGGGPTGLTAALLLARYGLKVIIVERHHHRIGQPKAHAINPRSLEIFRQMGLDTTQLRISGVAPEDGDTVRFVESMAEKEHGTLPYERQGPETLEITPEPLFNVPQPTLEDFLLCAVESNEHIALYRGMQWEDCRKLEHSLASNVKERATGHIKVIHSGYVLDCGGANSRARDVLGIPFAPLPQYIQNEVHHLSVHFNADLSHFKPGTLWWVSSRLAEGTFICYDRSCNWVFVTYYNPKTTSPEKFTEYYCRELVDNAIGEKVPYDILSITDWSTWPRTAGFYQSKQFPRAFVVGDAAHAFPPTGGLGVNTGIADAHNLAWKIHAVEKNWAKEAILSTYGKERRPVAVANAHQSVKNQVKLRNLKAALRDPPTDTASDAWARWKEKLDSELRANAEHFDSIGLQIGYRYGGNEVLERKEPCNIYAPSNQPGCRLPHAWISFAGQRLSTLDLVDGTGFVLFLSDSWASFLATAVADSIATPATIHTFCVGSDFVVLDDLWVSTVGLSAPGSGLLIRPDQHILGNVTSLEEIERLVAACLSP
ncbi:FAD binding domain-containing protein [Aspergillus terricola var. indicus]